MTELPDVPEEPTKEAPAESAVEVPAAPAEIAGPVDPSADRAPRPTDDELFAELVAGFDTEVDAGARSWPAAEDVADLAPQPRPRAAGTEPLIKLPRIQAIPPVDPRTWTPEEDPDDGHFVPPPPPPLPQTETATRLAIAAVVGGILLILVSAMGYLPALGGMGELIGIGLFIGGAGTLYTRMRDEDDDDEDDDPQRGAVV